eukprot:Gb_27858 [translate_table: standard]
MLAVTYVDSSAAQALKELYQEYKARNIQMALSNPNQEVLLTLAKSGVLELVGKEWYFVRVHDAVQVCLSHMQDNYETISNADESPKQLDVPKRHGKDSRPKIFSWKQDANVSNPERQPLITERTEY